MAGHVGQVESAVDLLDRLRADGFDLVVAGDRLRIRPADRVSPELKDELRQRRDELVEMLTYVTLKGGLVAPLAALRLGWELEDRGFAVVADPAVYVRVEPTVRLTAEDRCRIHRWRVHLAALAEYEPGVPA